MDATCTDMQSLPWINPVGGIGDMLMLSGVLRQVVRRDPQRRFNLVRRTRYVGVFEHHEAIAAIGHPPKGAPMMHSTYWSMETLGPGGQRPYQVLARAYGLETPIDEALYLAGAVAADDALLQLIPWQQLNVVIAPATDSPRKAVPPATWHELVARLHNDGAFVMQVGLATNLRIRNAYSLLGLTTPQQLVALLQRCDLVVTVDNFVMHAAHLAGSRTVALWGPTDHTVYGYPEQVHLQARLECVAAGGQPCIDPANNRDGSIYGTDCKLGQRHCMNSFGAARLHDACRRALN